jgi:hypothetical protein
MQIFREYYVPEQRPSKAMIETPCEAIASTGLHGVLRFAQNDSVF